MSMNQGSENQLLELRKGKLAAYTTSLLEAGFTHQALRPRRPNAFCVRCLKALHFAKLSTQLQKSHVLQDLEPTPHFGTPNPIPAGE